MKICHTTINSIEFERRIHNQADSAAEHQWQTTVIAFGQSGEVQKQRISSFEVHRVKTGPFQQGPFKFLLFNIRIIPHLFANHYDIVHCHDLWTLPAGVFRGLFSKIKIIYDAHEYYAGLEIFRFRRLRRALWMLTEKICIRFVDVLITVSEPLGELYQKRYPALKHIVIIRNVLKYTKIARHSVNLTRPHIIYQGHFKPGRGLKNLILAVRDLSHIDLTLLGGGELKDELIQFVQSLGLSSRIHFETYLPLNDLLSYSSRFDAGMVLFQPSSENYAYALPNKFFEYIMAGLPVIGSQIETLKNYIASFNVGLTVDPDNIEQIKDAIQRMFSSESDFQRWQKNALKAATELNWEREQEKLIEIYERCVV